MHVQLAHYIPNAVNHIADGTPGDGSSIELCPTAIPDLKCMSSGRCAVCEGFVDGSGNVLRYEGCSNVIAPICDADLATAGIQVTGYNDRSLAQICTGCMNIGKNTNRGALCNTCVCR